MSERLKSFQEKGYVVLPGLLTPEELARLKEGMERDATLRENEYSRSDGRGMRTRVTLWNILPDNIAGAIGRAEKVVNVIEEMLGGEVYHYHSKLIMKDPGTGGAFLWHQDYGYWYEYHCLFPDMGTLWIAVDKADRNNGCLQVLEGSHKMGRIETMKQGDQIVVDPERLAAVRERLPLRYLELNPGDAVFFHGNLVHTSDQNVSGNRRWAFLVCYNRASNQPYAAHPHAEYEPIEKIADADIIKSPVTLSGKEDLKFWSEGHVGIPLGGKAEVEVL